MTVCITDWRRGQRRAAILVEISFGPRLHQETLASGSDECERLTRDNVRNEWMNPAVCGVPPFLHVCECAGQTVNEGRRERIKNKLMWVWEWNLWGMSEWMMQVSFYLQTESRKCIGFYTLNGLRDGWMASRRAREWTLAAHVSN